MSQEALFQLLEGCFAAITPLKLGVFLGQIDERSGEVGIMGDEVAVEVTYAEEGSDVLNLHGGWPFRDPFELRRVHGNMSWSDDHSEVINFLGIEGALGRFQEETLLSEDVEDSAGSRMVFV